MRDTAFVLIILVLLPMALFHPWIGIMAWTWVSIMNPHRNMWTVSEWPIAAAIAGVTLVGMVLTRDKRHFPLTPITFTLALFALWIAIAAGFTISGDPFPEMFSRVMKILFMIFIALIVLHDKRHILWLTGVVAGSIAFYGVKGGIFTLGTGGSFRVWGPSGSFIEGNNEVALALILIIPLIFFFYGYAQHKWIKRGLILAMVLCAIASLGSYSRGALVAMAAMSVVLWWHSGKRVLLAPIFVLLGLVILAFLPQEWWARMGTISSYEQDESAMGRINAWWAMFNIAKERLFGGGFDIYNAEVFARYAPIPEDVHAAHSIYFQVLGEHGFVGLFIYMLLWLMTWFSAGWIRKRAQAIEDMQWAASLAAMCQVSMAGFAVGGAFLSLAYFDLPFNIMVIVVLTRLLVEKRLKELKPAPPPRQAGAPVAGGL
jgi:putative inorganic carbon (hco3(-)) transporter